MVASPLGPKVAARADVISRFVRPGHRPRRGRRGGEGGAGEKSCVGQHMRTV